MLYDSIPVLMYHHVMPEMKDLNVTPQIFEEQIAFLRRNGWKPLDSNEFLYLIQNSQKQRKKCVLITFDDGFVDNFIYAYPVLKKYKMKAILFIATEFITDLDIKRKSFTIIPHKEIWKIAFSDKKYEVMCTWDEIREMHMEGIFDIQSHGHSHKIPEFIGKDDYNMIENDLKLSQYLILKKLNKKSSHLAWPKGRYNEHTIELAIKLGFKALYTTQRGANTNQEDLLHIKRIAVKCKGSSWLKTKLKIYNSSLLSKIYSKIRT